MFCIISSFRLTLQDLLRDRSEKGIAIFTIHLLEEFLPSLGILNEKEEIDKEWCVRVIKKLNRFHPCRDTTYAFDI